MGSGAVRTERCAQLNRTSIRMKTIIAVTRASRSVMLFVLFVQAQGEIPDDQGKAFVRVCIRFSVGWNRGRAKYYLSRLTEMLRRSFIEGKVRQDLSRCTNDPNTEEWCLYRTSSSASIITLASSRIKDSRHFLLVFLTGQ